MSGKELFIRFTARAFRKLLSVYVFSYFPIGFEGRILSVPDHCVYFYFRTISSTCNLPIFVPTWCWSYVIGLISTEITSKSSLCIDLDIYFRLYITKNAACQMGQIAAIFDFITTCIGLVVALCVTFRTFRRNPYHNKGRFTPWTFRPKSTRTHVLDILCPISGNFGPALVHSNEI